MKGYLCKALLFYGGIFAVAGLGWAVSMFFLMPDIPGRMTVCAARCFPAWIGCFLAGMVLASCFAAPVHEGLKKLEAAALSESGLDAVCRRNERLPGNLGLLMIVMITMFGATASAFSPVHGAGPASPSGLLPLILAADLVFPACLYGILHSVTHPANDRIYREIRSRSMPFTPGGLRLGTRIIGLFSAVSIGLALWTGTIALSEGEYRARQEMLSHLSAFGYAVAREIESVRGEGAGIDDLKPAIDRISLGGTACAFLLGSTGDILYNPSGMDLSSVRQDYSRTSIRDALRSGTACAVPMAGHDRVLCLIPLGSGLALGLSPSPDALRQGSGRLFAAAALLVVTALLAVGVTGFVLLTMVAAPVKKAADMIRNVAAGTGASDFTARLPVHGSDEMGEMAAGLNELMGRIEGAVSGMKGTAACVDRSSRDVSCCADDLMNLLLDQAASVEAVAQTIEEMTAFIKQNAVSAESGRDKTRSMVIMAGRSELSMRSLVEAMDGISLASKKIGDIISTVNEVAFQTNLLALNAAVEAARAGEHGRGFAVVAGEVRALARRSAEAAGEIRRLIEDTVTRIRTGDELAKNAEKSISGIIEGINDLSETIEEFASTSSEQAGGVDDLNRSVQRMDIVTQKNAAAIHQLSDSAESMLSSAGTLAGDVARFNPTKSRKHTSGLRRERKESETGEVE